VNRSAEKYRAEAFTLLSSLLWGTSFVAVKAGLDYIEPLWFAQTRLLAAGLILAVTARGKLGRYLGDSRVWVLALLCSLGFVAQNVGMQSITSSKAAFYINASIVPVAVLSHKFLHEAFGMRKIVGVAIAVVAIYLLTTGGSGGPEAFRQESFQVAEATLGPSRETGLTRGSLSRRDTFVLGTDPPGSRRGDLRSFGSGDLIVLMTSLSWAVYGVMMKGLLRDADIQALPLTAAIFILSGVIIAVPAALLAPFPLRLGMEGLLLLLYIILFCTALPNVLWVFGLRKMTVTASAAILLVEPIAALWLGVLILKDRFTLVEGVGAFGILLAIGLIAHHRASSPPSAGL